MAQLTATDWRDKQSAWEGLEAHIQIKSIMQLHKRSVGCCKMVEGVDLTGFGSVKS